MSLYLGNKKISKVFVVYNDGVNVNVNETNIKTGIRILGVNGKDVDDDEIDDDKHLLDLLSLLKNLRKVINCKVSLDYVPFWMSEEEKKLQIRLLGLYEIVIDHAWKAIDELFHTQKYDIEDDDFDDYHFHDE